MKYILKWHLLLQSSVSQDPSEIILICWFAAQKYISYYYLWWKQMCCLIILRKPWYILLGLMNRKFKRALLSLLINLMLPYWIKAFISFFFLFLLLHTVLLSIKLYGNSSLYAILLLCLRNRPKLKLLKFSIALKFYSCMHMFTPGTSWFVWCTRTFVNICSITSKTWRKKL